MSPEELAQAGGRQVGASVPEWPPPLDDRAEVYLDGGVLLPDMARLRPY